MQQLLVFMNLCKSVVTMEFLVMVRGRALPLSVQQTAIHWRQRATVPEYMIGRQMHSVTTLLRTGFVHLCVRTSKDL